MNITGFDIVNFKGIRKAKIRFSENDAARVHTLVGLNESGKTTLLEALHSFSPDAETQLVVRSAKSVEEQREQWVPRDQISMFTGDVTVTAYVVATLADWERIGATYREWVGLDIDTNDFPKEFSASLIHSYKNGDYRSTAFRVNFTDIRVKGLRGRKFRSPSADELEDFNLVVRKSLPRIAYYPTFVFDFPKKIYLTSRDKSSRNRFYRQLFQDILDYDGSGYTIKESILDRLHKEDTKGIWDKWFSAFVGTTEEDKVKQVISRAESAVTELVFKKWNEVFGERVGAKEISIELAYEKGDLVKNSDGVEEEATVHDAYIRFRIKDGSSLYSVEDRSLGFRWFFSFLLFTQFRIHREKQQATIFLFDEPASNLHAAAQKKLLESFPAIARSPHRLMYSTHSHYMVEPKWLEQAYIVFDRLAVPGSQVVDEGTRPDSRVDIQAIPYRQFVSERPAQTSYFQPILDTLEVQPSSFDYKVGGLVVEGKSDFYYLRLAAIVVDRAGTPIFPATGSGTMGALVSLHRGWGLPVRVLFDGDRGGRDGRRKLGSEFVLSEAESTTISKLVPSITCVEDLFVEADQEIYGGNDLRARKSVLLRRVQEMLAAGEVPALAKETKSRMSALLKALAKFMG